MKPKYTLIERQGYNITAVTSAILEDMERRNTPFTNLGPITQKRIKAENIHVYHENAYFEHTQYADFEKKYKGLVFKAKVLWFNPMSGNGYAEGLNGEGSWTLYACNIKGAKTWYPETACVYVEPGDIVEVEVMPYYKNSILVCHTPGKLDGEKWASLDQSKLAFKCDENGKAINGLFA